METEEIISTVVQTQIGLITADPTLLTECVSGIADGTMTQFQTFIAANPIQLQPAWPTKPPVAPTVIVYPGESEEGEQLIGSILGQDISTGIEHTYLGTWFNSTHHIAIYSTNRTACVVVSKMVFWALLTARSAMEDLGLYNAKVIEGPLDLANEWSEQTGTDLVFRRTVHLIHDWLFSHDSQFAGELLAAVQIALTDNDQDVSNVTP